jgi:hypothetical protein
LHKVIKGGVRECHLRVTISRYSPAHDCGIVSSATHHTLPSESGLDNGGLESAPVFGTFPPASRFAPCL